MPYPIFQRTAPKHDRIGVTLEECGAGPGSETGGVGRAPPATSNSNLDAAAVVRVAGEGEAEGSGRGGVHSRGSSSSSSSRQQSIGGSMGSLRQVGERWIQDAEISYTWIPCTVADAPLVSLTQSTSPSTTPTHPPTQVFDRQPDGSYVRRVDLSHNGGGLDPAMLDARLASSSSSSSSSSNSNASSRAVSPLGDIDTSVQTFMRVPAEDAGARQQQQQPPPPHHHQHRGRVGSASLSSSAHSLRPPTTNPSARPPAMAATATAASAAAAARRLTTDVLSPTGSSSSSFSSHHFPAAGHDGSSSNSNNSGGGNYGARNLATVSCRKSASIVTAATAAAAAAAAAGVDRTTAIHHGQSHRHRASSLSLSASISSSSGGGGGIGSSSSSSSSGLLGKLKDGSLEVLARFGVVTPPSPKSYAPPTVSTRTHAMHPSSSYFSSPQPAPPVLLMLPSPQQAAHGRHGSGGLLGMSSGSTTTITTTKSGKHGRIVTHELARLSLAPAAAAAHNHQRGASAASCCSSSLSSSDGGHHHLKHQHQRQQDGNAHVSYATECVRTALEVIISRLQTAQSHGPDATLQEARTFVDGGGVDALLRGLETLGHEPAVAHNLLYVLRVVVLDPSARRAAASGAKGRMLVEQVPAVLRIHHHHAGEGPILKDGLAVMAALLRDPVTREAAAPLLLTPESLAVVWAAQKGKEAAVCAEILKHAAGGGKDGRGVAYRAD
jgi:hypothetical protein